MPPRAIGRPALRDSILLLLWQRMLSLQTQLPRVDLGLLDPRAVALEPPTHRIGVFYRDEFGAEVGGIDGIACYHELADRLRSVRGCGQLGSIYWFAHNYSDDLACKRQPGGIVRETEVWYDLDPSHPDFARLHGRAFPSAFIVSRRYGKFHELPRDWIAPPTWEHHYARSRELPWPFDPSAQLVVMLNKFTAEWNGQPLNFLSLRMLERMADSIVRSGGSLVYARASGARHPGVVDDSQRFFELGEKALIARRTANATDPWRGRVFTMEALALSSGLGFNGAQLALLSLAGCTVSVQGGPSWLAAKAGGHAIVFHRRGTEARQAYQHVFPLFGMLSSLAVVTLPDDVAPELEAHLLAGRCARRSPFEPAAWGASAELAAAWRTPPAESAQTFARVVRASARFHRLLSAVPAHRYHGGDGFTMRLNVSLLGQRKPVAKAQLKAQLKIGGKRPGENSTLDSNSTSSNLTHTS